MKGYDYFICHAYEDRNSIVNEVLRCLEGQGITYWIDDNNIKKGESISSKINQGMQDSTNMLVFITDNFFKKDYPQDELNCFFHLTKSNRERAIIPIVDTNKYKIEDKLPILADKAHFNLSMGPENIAKTLKDYLQDKKQTTDQASSPEPLKSPKSRHLTSMFEQDIARMFRHPDVVTWIRENITSPLGRKIAAGNIRLFTISRGSQHHHKGVEYRHETEASLESTLELDKADGLVGHVFENADCEFAYWPCPKDAPFYDKHRQTDTKIGTELAVPVSFPLNEARIGVILASWHSEYEEFSKKGLEDKGLSGRDGAHLERQKKIVAKYAHKMKDFLVHRYMNDPQENEELNNIVDKYIQKTNSDRGYIAYVNENGLLKYAKGKNGESGNFLAISSTEGICGKVLREGKLEITADLSTHPEAVVSDPDCLQLLATPIKVNNVVVGVFDVEKKKFDNKKRRDTYSDSDIEIMKDAAEEAARRFDILDEPYLENIQRSLATAFFCEGGTKDQIEKMLCDYTRFIFKLYINKTDIQVTIERPTEGELETKFLRANIEKGRIYLKNRGKPESVLVVNPEYLAQLAAPARNKILHCAQLAASALKRQKNIDGYKKLSKTLATLGRVSIIANIIPPHLFWAVKQANEILGASHTTLFWVSPKEPSLLIPGVSTAKKIHTKKRYIRGYNANSGLTGYVFREKRPLLIENMKDTDSIKALGVDNEWAHIFSETEINKKGEYDQEARSYLACPIIDRKNKKIVGVLRSYLEKREVKPTFTKSDQLILQAMASSVEPLLVQFLCCESNHDPRVKIVITGQEKTEHSIVELHPPRLNGYNFDKEEINDAFVKNQFLNLHFGHGPTNKDRNVTKPNQIDSDSCQQLIEKSIRLGVKSITFDQGIDFIHTPNWKRILLDVHRANVIPIVFTECEKLDLETAEFFHKLNTTVVLRLNERIDFHGKEKKNVALYDNKALRIALENLWTAGYCPFPDLNVSTVAVCYKVSIKDIKWEDEEWKNKKLQITKLWKYCRENGLYPFIQAVRPGWESDRNQSDKSNEFLFNQHLDNLRADIKKIENGYGFTVNTDSMKHECQLPKSRLFIDENGMARLCPCLMHDKFKDEIREDNLQSVIKKLQGQQQKKKFCEPECGKCGLKKECNGCSEYSIFH